MIREIRALGKNGEEFDCEIAIREIVGPPESPPMFTVVMRDITERKRAEEQIKRDLVEEEVFLKLSQEMAKVLQLDKLLQLVVEAPMTIIPRAHQCVIHLLDEERKKLLPAAYVGPEFPDGQREDKGMHVGQGIAGLAFKNRQTICVGDVQRASRYLPLNSRGRFRSLLVTPLVTGGRALGTLSINSQAAEAFTPDDIRLLETLAAQAAVVVENVQLYREVLSEERRMEAIIANMADGVIMLDHQDRVLTLNPAAERMLGLREEEVLRRRVAGDGDDPRLQLLAYLYQGQEPSPPSSSTPDEPGAEGLHTRIREVTLDPPLDRILQVYTSPLRDEKGGSWGQVLVLHDVTRERELDQMKEDFISSVSHELRTPLFSIQGFVELILKGKVPDRKVQQEFLTRVAEQTQRLAALVDDLLDLSRLEKGRLELEREQVQVQDIVERVMRQLGNMAQEKSISLAAQMDSSLPTVEADPRRVEQVLVNLVGNALKFTPSGGRVVVGARVEGDELVVQVTDTGIGIPPQATPYLFSKFYQVNGSTTRRAGGTGLGLYICKLIVEAHGGRIWVESPSASLRTGEPNRGSTFSFTLPLTACPGQGQ